MFRIMAVVTEFSKPAIMLKAHPQGTLLLIRAQPGSRKQGILGTYGERLKVAVHAVPEKGKANQAVIEVLAKALDLKRSQVQLVSGETSQEKTVLICGVTMVELQGRLAAYLAP